MQQISENAMSDESSTGGLARRLQMRRVDQSMARAQTQSKKQQQDYTGILVDNLRENGQIILVSDDMAFAGSLRELVCNTLKM